MNKKLLALLLAGVLALGGVVATVMYARAADARAFGNAELVPVLVVTQQVPAGSPADRLAGSLETKRVPKALVPDGVVTDLAALGQEVTNAVLVPGETLLGARFGEAKKAVDKTDLPEGMQRLDLLLEAPRVPSGLKAGDLVGVLASYAGENAGGSDANSTKLVLSKVRVIGLEDGVAGGQGEAAVGAGTKITLAVNTAQAEQIANVAEFGTIWLTGQNDETDVASRRTPS
ncbi:Flp pilus assembly protein CpaB [Aeromicrobium sp. CF3.5]|uniref:Flp pilus assembly protein CpaB n=1 Tax=Aeromicrobium sp. CF3.5 TaxID=3373078 RepID=UPI003EE7A2F6